MVRRMNVEETVASGEESKRRGRSAKSEAQSAKDWAYERLHSHRTAGRYRDHRDPGGPAFARVEPRHHADERA